MQRYFIELKYNGSDFYGWQKQPNQISVQETIESALTKLFSKEIKVVGCGRTDTGVHAYKYILHLELPERSNPEILLYKLNKITNNSIAFTSIRAVPNDLHARFSAKTRTYRYFIHQQKDPFLAHTSLYFPIELDLQAMNQAASYFVGEQDFTSFSKLHTDVKTNMCNVTLAEWRQIENGKYYFEITANRFLRNMVRATVGTLLEVGINKIKAESIIEILKAKNRNAAKKSVAAHGLFLWDITYDN
jgi:tRNA pseudouridine38-40 synthase